MTASSAASSAATTTPDHALAGDALGSSARPLPDPAPARLAAPDGTSVVAGLIDVVLDATGFHATLARFDRPGVFASMFFAQGVRDVELTMADGRSVQARIVRTSVTSSGERTCQIAGTGPFR